MFFFPDTQSREFLTICVLIIVRANWIKIFQINWIVRWVIWGFCSFDSWGDFGSLIWNKASTSAVSLSSLQISGRMESASVCLHDQSCWMFCFLFCFVLVFFLLLFLGFLFSETGLFLRANWCMKQFAGAVTENYTGERFWRRKKKKPQWNMQDRQESQHSCRRAPMTLRHFCQTWNLEAAEDTSRRRTALMKWEGPGAQLCEEPHYSLCRPTNSTKAQADALETEAVPDNNGKKNESRKSLAALPYLFSWKCARNRWKANSFTPEL